MKQAKRTRSMFESGTKRMIAMLNDDGTSESYRIQVRVAGRWTNVGSKMDAEREDCDGLTFAHRVYLNVAV